MLHSEPLSEAALNFPGLRHQELEGTVLSTIINQKVATLQQQPSKALPERRVPLVSLAAALRQRGRHFILECKKASPTLGDFARDFNLDRLLDCYNDRASAISVLCEEHFFKGSLDYLCYVKERTSLPVVCKDFILSKGQLKAAYAAGADAVLLMLSVLTEEKFSELYAYAQELGLEVLCEVATPDEAQFAKQAHIPIVGINNRDMKTLQVDLHKAPALGKIFTSSTVVVSESGLSSHAQISMLEPIHNYLVGSSLTGSKNLYFAANSLLYGVNKVCGLTTKEAVRACVQNKVALGGLIFVPHSPRQVTVAQAQELIAAAQGKLRFVGVFQNEKPAKLVEICRHCQLDLVQLHGEETPAYIRELKALQPELEIMVALNPKQPDKLACLEEYQKLCCLILLDSPAPGSGQSLDFKHLPEGLCLEKTLLAGGIGRDNLQEALSLGFAGLDLNSKLEQDRGIKDPALITEAFELINHF